MKGPKMYTVYSMAIDGRTMDGYLDVETGTRLS